MVRETKKRRAKGNTATNLPKYRKLRPRPDGDESDEGRYKPSDEVSVEKAQGRKLLEKGPSLPAVSRNDDGGTESQSFVALLAEQSKKNKQATAAVQEFLNLFTEHIDASSTRLHTHMENLTHSCSEREGDFLSAFQVAYALSRPSRTNSRATDGLAFASLYPHFQALIVHAQNSIEQCELLDHRISQARTAELLEGLKWDEEHAEVEELLRLGQRLGRQKYEALVKGVGAPEAPSPQMARLYGPEQTDSSVAWGSVARKQMRALRKLLKATNAEGQAASLATSFVD